MGLPAQNDTTFVANGNPIITYKYTADPAVLVYDDKVYLYAGHDECPPPHQHYLLNEWCVFSSSDLKTWTEHPVPLKAKDFAWAKGEAWASQVIEKGGKFYWYVTVEHGTIPGKSIGVAVADSPLGPFKDARGSALITNDMTTEYTRISWDDIDPSVYIDEDGQVYLFWGNTQCYYARLKENMIELDSPIMPVQLPRFTEAPWIHKQGEWYYLSYASEFPEKICYAMSKNINGPWEYKGILNEIAGNSNTNHQAIIEFKGDWYFIYHNGSINTEGGSFRRSVCIDRLYYNPDGTMKRVIMTSEGIH
ncbi:MAG: glycoside hydrolase family 43 protein [Bacteroides sp.]|nr:glycoside hydrolase family 43 protein [Bacteroides sp.]